MLQDILYNVIHFMDLRDTYVMQQLGVTQSSCAATTVFEQLLESRIFGGKLNAFKNILAVNGAVLTGGIIDALASEYYSDPDRDIDIWCPRLYSRCLINSLNDTFSENVVWENCFDFDWDSDSEQVVYSFLRSNSFDQNRLVFDFSQVDVVGHDGDYSGHPERYLDLVDLKVCRNYYDGEKLYLSPQFLTRTETIIDETLLLSRDKQRTLDRLTKYTERGYVFYYKHAPTLFDYQQHVPRRVKLPTCALDICYMDTFNPRNLCKHSWNMYHKSDSCRL